jgi:glycosyltransferase involved in cell wall biosynthesis
MKESQNLPAGISVVIPCLNEAETLERAVMEAKAGIAASGLEGEVVVADNGSTDGSQDIARRAGAVVHSVPHRGYGAALHAGILAARYEYVAFADADLSYPFRETPNLLGPLRDGRADIVLGSRLRGTIEPRAMPFLNRHVGTPVLSWMIRRIYRIPSSDCNSGMRAVRRAMYPELRLRCPGMEFASEMIIRAAECRWRYAEVPISFRKDQRSRPPHLRRWQDGWRHLRFILGNAPSFWLISAPAVAAFALLAIAFLLSLQEFFHPHAQVLFHTAFGCIALSMPFSLFASSNLLVKATRSQSNQQTSAGIAFLNRLSDRAIPFYAAVFVYALALAQLTWLGWKWYNARFGDLFEIGGVIRLMVLTILATFVFSIDMALGLIKLVPFQMDKT